MSQALLEIDEASFTVFHRGKRLFLGNTKEWWLFRQLYLCRGYVSVSELIDTVWDRCEETSDGAIRTAVYQLRKKLRDGGLHELRIVNTRGHYALATAEGQQADTA